MAEKYANAVGQLSDANDRSAHAVHDLQVERITRQDLIDGKQSLRAVLRMLIKIYTFAPNFKFGTK